MLQLFAGSAIGVLVGVLLGTLLYNRSGSGEAAGGASVGLLFGMLIGLCDSPIVGTVLSGAIAAVGVVVPALAKSKDGSQFVRGPFLVSAALLSTLGVVGGIALRTSNVLDFEPRSPSLRQRYEAEGFSNDQVNAIMERLAKTAELPRISRAASKASSNANGHLLGSGDSRLTLSTLAKLPCSDRLKSVNDSPDEALRSLVTSMQALKVDERRICDLLAELANR